jgi:hypothetical protein
VDITDPKQIRKHFMTPIIVGDSCRGFILRRRTGEIEAIDTNERSRGVFGSEAEADASFTERIAI